jgi:hypothetical protein
MTHDQLLAKLNNLPEVIGLAEFKARHDALRAVVELHTPGVGQPYCSRCDVAYPCATIYAIETELLND